MALTANVELLNVIPDVVLCGNKIPLKFQASTNFIETAGTKAEIILTWTDFAVADEYFDLLLYNETVRFTCKAAPDNSGIQFRDNSLAETLGEWVARVGADLKTNYLITKYYDVIIDSLTASIIIIAKTEGDDYSLEFTAGAGIDVTPTETNKTGTSQVLRSFYGIAVMLYCKDTFVAEQVLNVDSDGLAEIDISDLLKPYLSTEFEWPESNGSFIFDSPSAMASFYFYYCERWGSAEYKALTLSSTYHVMYGGLSWMQLAKYNLDGENFWSKLILNKYFLSWAPLTRYVGPEEPIKLYFANHSAADELRLKVKLYTATSNSTITLGTVTGAVDKVIYEMVLSPAIAEYSGLADETLVKFEAWVDDENDTHISEIRTFILDYSHYEHTRYFIFRNSLGVYECLRTTGLMTRSGNYTREGASVEVNSDYTSRDREDISISNTRQQKFTLAMGWLNRYGDADEYRNWLEDFTCSREIYQAIGSTLKPIRIISDNLDWGKDRDTTKGFVFEFVNAFKDEYFTKEITRNLENESFVGDFERAQ